MKAPVSLDLFPANFFPSGMYSDRVLLVWYLTRRRELFLLNSPRFARHYDFAIAVALDRLGGLGGVW